MLDVAGPLLTETSFQFNLTTPSPMPAFLNVHFICETASRLLFLSMHWARAISAFQTLRCVPPLKSQTHGQICGNLTMKIFLFEFLGLQNVSLFPPKIVQTCAVSVIPQEMWGKSVNIAMNTPSNMLIISARLLFTWVRKFCQLMEASKNLPTSQQLFDSLCCFDSAVHQTSLVRQCWSELFTLGLAQCSETMSLPTILAAIVNHLQSSVQQGEATSGASATSLENCFAQRTESLTSNHQSLKLEVQT